MSRIRTFPRPGVLALGLALALAGVAGPARPQSPAPPAATVDTAPAVRAEIAPLHWAPGSVSSRQDARVAAEIGGRVVEVVEVGTRLRRGDPMARLDDAAFRLGERQAAADLERLQAQLDLVRRQEQRFEALVQGAGISGAQLDQVRAERRMREQDLASARVALERARLQRRQATVRAPFDGVVVERAVQLGEYLSVGAPVARLVDTDALEVRARAPVALAGRLRAGDAVSLRSGGEVVAATLSTVVPVGDEASRQLELRVRLPEGPVARVSGMAVEVGVPRDAPRQAIAVPRDALLLRSEGNYVLRVGEDGLAQRVPVDTGAAIGELVEVQGAVRPGDLLVVRGGERLQPGQAVSVRNPGRPVVPAAVAAAPRRRP